MNSATCSCENGKYLARITSDPMIMCGEIIEETRAVSTNAVNKTKDFCILFAFLLLIINYYSIIDSCYYLLWPDEMK